MNNRVCYYDAQSAISRTYDGLDELLLETTLPGSTSYTYEPFGNVSISPSATNTNPYQFTGRENDGTGLYFYRARYYGSTFQRFVAQDPLDFRGRDADLYGYVLNDPLDARDPFGLTITPASPPKGCKPGDCPDHPPQGDPLNWRPETAYPWWVQLIRHDLTHQGQTCYEAMINGRYLHCCYDGQGNPLYDGNSAWEDYPPDTWRHILEWLGYEL